MAFVLILLLTAACLVGVLLIQAPSGVQRDPAAYAQWLAGIQPKYGFATNLFSSLGLLSIFGSWWFRLLMALLAANILVCTVHRGGKLLRASLARRRVVMPERFFERARLRESVAIQGISFSNAETVLRASLRRSGYRVVLRREGEAVHVFSQKNRFSPVATILHHMGLVALLAGFVVGGMWGYEDPGFVVAEGASRAIGDTGLVLQLDSFVDEYYPEGPPKDYRSDVVLYDSGQEVRRATVRVNSPMVYNGVRVHQSFYGPAAVVQVQDGRNEVLFKEAVPLQWRSQERPVGSFVIPSEGLEVFVIGPASSFIDSVIPPGQMRLEIYRNGANSPLAMENLLQGEPRLVEGLSYTFIRERQFSGFMVVRNPGKPLLWSAAIGIVLGLMWVLYFPYRQLWAMAQQQGDGTWIVRLGAAPGKWGEFSKEFRRIAERMAGTAGRLGGQAQVVPMEGL
ncbi:MAG: cytochrome c biogenesis protein ResB [Chloroflexi bacterium]|nr:cytochrome c biogenesis protein ResB [Chloroflexota bacterium]